MHVESVKFMVLFDRQISKDIAVPMVDTTWFDNAIFVLLQIFFVKTTTTTK